MDQSQLHSAVTTAQPWPPSPSRLSFYAQERLPRRGVTGTILKYASDVPIFVQGEPAKTIFYIRSGGARLSVVSRAGKEGVVAMLGPGSFIGEGAMAGQEARMHSATTTAPSMLLSVEKTAMTGLLRDDRDFSDLFMAHLLTRHIRVEADIVDQCLNSSERRLARTLLLLVEGRRDVGPGSISLKLSQSQLAEMVGTSRSRVNGFMTKFRRLGLVDYDERGIRIRASLATFAGQD